jgi:hypothetical protein
MAPVAEDTNDLGCERFVQKFDYGFAVRAITRCDSTILDVLSGALAQSFDISEKWLISHELTPLQYEFRGAWILTQIRHLSRKGAKIAKAQRRVNCFGRAFAPLREKPFLVRLIRPAGK